MIPRLYSYLHTHPLAVLVPFGLVLGFHLYLFIITFKAERRLRRNMGKFPRAGNIPKVVDWKLSGKFRAPGKGGL